MSKSKRGPERRHGERSGPAHGPVERRINVDRRRNAYISKLDLCRGLPYAEVESILERCPVKHFERGEVLLEPGQANHDLYFLLSGRVEIRLQSTVAPVTDVINAGECIGEMSIIDGQPTSAFVIATEASAVLAVHENVFWSKLATNPQTVRNLSRVLAERMRKRNAATMRALEQEMRLEQLQKELLAAHEIQTGMLPSGRSMLSDVPGLDVYARMDVVKSVGGDFYDAFALDERRVCIAIGDVSGKGMPAALFMVRALTLLRIELNKSNDLGEAMCRFNRALCETNISHMFVSLVVVWVDTADRSANYVNAGHLPLLHASGDGPFVALDGSRGLIAGVLSDTAYTVAAIELGLRDRLLLYTDGVTETRNAQRQFYNLQGLTDFLQGKHWASPGDLVEAVFADTRDFARGAPRSDDITVVAIELQDPGAVAGAP